MAQIPQKLIIKEPGNLDEGKESDSKEYTVYGVYRCIFKQINNSLYLEMKNTKNKRVFSSKFHRKSLINMNLKQSISKIISMLNAAKSGTQSELKFTISFGNIQNTQKNNQNDKFIDDEEEEEDGSNINQIMETPQLSKHYQKGDSMYLTVSIEKAFFDPEQYIFKLIEQSYVTFVCMFCVQFQNKYITEREETDIIYDIIEDMQNEMDGLKKENENNKHGVAVWKRSAQPSSGDMLCIHIHYFFF